VPARVLDTNKTLKIRAQLLLPFKHVTLCQWVHVPTLKPSQHCLNEYRMSKPPRSAHIPCWPCHTSITETQKCAFQNATSRSVLYPKTKNGEFGNGPACTRNLFIQ